MNSGVYFDNKKIFFDDFQLQKSENRFKQNMKKVEEGERK